MLKTKTVVIQYLFQYSLLRTEYYSIKRSKVQERYFNTFLFFRAMAAESSSYDSFSADPKLVWYSPLDSEEETFETKMAEL